VKHRRLDTNQVNSYDKPEMIIENPSELRLKRDERNDLAFRPLETALEKSTIDAVYMQTGPLSQLSEAVRSLPC
jgi:hypothetical protein